MHVNAVVRSREPGLLFIATVYLPAKEPLACPRRSPFVQGSGNGLTATGVAKSLVLQGSVHRRTASVHLNTNDMLPYSVILERAPSSLNAYCAIARYSMKSSSSQKLACDSDTERKPTTMKILLCFENVSRREDRRH